MYMLLRKPLLALGLALAMITATATIAADVGQDIINARQETQIWTTYALNPNLRAMDIKVSVQNGKATLRGVVAEGINKELATQIALGVGGIQDVDNKIEVQHDYTPPAPSSERSYGDIVEDATITAAVKSKLLWSRYTDGFSTDVDTLSGKVTLSGNTDSAAARDLAGSLAMNTRGVVAIDNRLNIKPEKSSASKKASNPGQEVSDTWITTKVKATYAYSKNIDGSNISVSTDAGIVTLSGQVDSSAGRSLAIELAKNVRGVKSVQSEGLIN